MSEEMVPEAKIMIVETAKIMIVETVMTVETVIVESKQMWLTEMCEARRMAEVSPAEMCETHRMAEVSPTEMRGTAEVVTAAAKVAAATAAKVAAATAAKVAAATAAKVAATAAAKTATTAAVAATTTAAAAGNRWCSQHRCGNKRGSGGERDCCRTTHDCFLFFQTEHQRYAKPVSATTKVAPAA